MTMQKLCRYGLLSLLAGISSILFWLVMASPSPAHWADLSAADITVKDTEVQITLTYPTKLTAFADADRDGQLSVTEIGQSNAALKTFLEEHIRLSDDRNRTALLTLQLGEQSDSPMAVSAPDSHTTLQLTYIWPDPIQDLTVDYTLFVSNVSDARCLATISQAEQFTTHIFTPQETTLTLTLDSDEVTAIATGVWLVPLVGVLLWGGVRCLTSSALLRS